jgi:hypothetical protein
VIVTIQCAGSKRKSAGFLKTQDGRPVLFVAQPELAPPAANCVYARPDDASDAGGTWREQLVAYNASCGNNPLGLLPAFELYENDIYRALVKKFGTEKTYILSAGWGLIHAAFLTPAYDITFSTKADNLVRRRKRDIFYDLSLLPANTTEQVVFFGSKEYVPLFAALAGAVRAERIVFYNSATPPSAPGCNLVRFVTRARTNWQYECAAAFLRGALSTRSGATTGSDQISAT